MQLNVLIIDDEEIIRNQLVSIFNGVEIEGNKLIVSAAEDFDKGMLLVSESDYDFVILDLCKGKPTPVFLCIRT